MNGSKTSYTAFDNLMATNVKRLILFPLEVFRVSWARPLRFRWGILHGLVVSSVLMTATRIGASEVGDWPQFLGPNRNGISAETNLLDRWPDSGPTLIWEK